MKKTSHIYSVNAFTLVELLVVIGIIAVLAALALPVFGKVQAQSKTTKCAANLRQLGIAALLYAGENNMTLPVTSHQAGAGGKSWTLTLQEYANGKLIFRCPSDELKARNTYAINDLLTPNPDGVKDPNLDIVDDTDFDYSRISRIPSPRETLLFTEASTTNTNTDHFHFARYHGMPLPPEIFADEVAVQRHNGSANYLFVDGHLETLTWLQAQALLNRPNTRFTDPSIP